MRRPIAPSFLVAAALAACAADSKDPPVASNESSSSESSSGIGGTTLLPIPTTGEGVSEESTGGPSTGGGFIVTPDGGVARQCDVWTDDCPNGEKCMPWANNGGNAWNATRCVPLDTNAVEIGDECQVEGSGTTGIDNCGPRAMCYYVDPETNLGTCVGFCQGSPEAPSCEAGSICTIVNDGVLTLCRPECDPILQDCEGQAACLQATGTNGFTCIIDASGDSGLAGDPCGFINSCDPGLLCATAETLPNCNAESCCTEFCDLLDAEPNAFCSLGGGTSCVPWFAEGDAPPDLAHVGLCVIPQ